MARNLLTTGSLREYLEDDQLIFVQGKYYSPSCCLWTSEARIAGKVSIMDVYADLEYFFREQLGVQMPDLAMLIQELKSRADGILSVQDAKELIKQINSMGPQTGSLEQLKELKILPVQMPNGVVNLQSTRDAFSIVDRDPLRKAFRGKISMLDYSLEEVRILRPFLSSLGLEDRFLSRTVTEESTARESSFDRVLTSEFRAKAYTLFRSVGELPKHVIE